MTKSKKYKIMMILFILSSIFLIYTDFYYGNISIETIQCHTIICFNYISNLILVFLNGSINSITTEDNVRIILIAITAIVIINKLELKKILFSISSVEAGNFKILIGLEKIKGATKNIEDDIKSLEYNKDKMDNKEESKLKESKEKLSILNLIISEPYIIKILDMLMNKKNAKVKIPMNVFKENISSIENIKQIFTYELKVNSVIINGLNEGVKDIIYDIYVEYCNVK